MMDSMGGQYDRGLPLLVGLIIALACFSIASDSLNAADKETVPGKPAAFYVATNGRDTWSGTLAEPNAAGTDGPFATLARARDAVRELKANAEGQTPAPIKVLVRGGKYFLNEPLVFTSSDSGPQASPIVYAAYPGEKPILSGGRKITGWQPYKDKILQASVPEAKEGKWKFQQLFLDGKRQVRARYPNIGPNDQWRAGWLNVEGPAEPGSFTAFKYKADSFPRRWAKPTQGEVFMIINWGYTTITAIKSMDEQNRSITMAQPVRNFARPPWVLPRAPEQAKLFQTDFSYGIPYRFFVENLLEELDQPGEWCWDSDEGKVYFWPPEDSMARHETVAPVLSCLVDLCGASYLTISGFTFTETVNGGDNMHPFGLEGAGAMFPTEEGAYCGQAVHLKDAEHCRIVGNTFSAVGGNAVYLEGYNFHNVIQGNEIAYAGHCGVGLMGTRERLNGVGQHPLFNEITDNSIHHCGVFDKVAPGVFCGVSDGNVIGHNRIEQMPHHAINLGNHGYGRNIVEYNDIRYTCQEAYDNAAINCWMENDNVESGEERSGHVFRFNRIADTPGVCTFGIYLDSYSSNCFVYGNIILRSGLSGIRVNGGKNNLIENNVIVGGKDAIGFWPGTCFWPNMKGFMTGNRLTRNIIGRSSTAFRLDTDKEDLARAIGDSDYNLFFNAPDEQIKVGLSGSDDVSLAQWKAMGYEEHSLVADPLFMDPDHDDYRLKPESPALSLGFQPIDVSQIGPRKP